MADVTWVAEMLAPLSAHDRKLVLPAIVHRVPRMALRVLLLVLSLVLSAALVVEAEQAAAVRRVGYIANATHPVD